MSLKNIFSKSIASFMAVSIMFGNISICGIGLKQVIAENLNAPEINIKISNEKYVQYEYTKLVQEDTEEKEEVVKGVAIQSELSVNPIFNQDTYLPTEKVELGITMPSLNGFFPEKAKMVEANTKFTNGEEININVNQNYDSNSGLLTIVYENTPDENRIIDLQQIENLKDEFKLIYIYPAEAYTGNNEEIKLDYTVNSKITFKTENGNVISESTQNFELLEKDNKGNIATFGVTDLKDKIYKGFMYSNVQNKTEYDTEYKTVSTFAVLNSGITEEMILELKDAKFVLNGEEENAVSANGNVVYKATGISRYEFDKILGQDGFVEFYKDENIIATVKYIDVDDAKKLAVIYSEEDVRIFEDDAISAIVEYTENTESLKLKVSKPISEGFLRFESQNAIKASQDYGCEVETIKYIITEGVVNEIISTTKIELLEPETKISLNSSNVNFSTVQTNETTLTINLDSTNSSTKLFDNPVIKIILPEGITTGNISSPSIVNGNGLEVSDKNVKVENNSITINVQGKQTSYDLNNVSGGATLVMDIINLDYNDTLPTHQDKIKVECIQGEEKVETQCDVNIISKEGLLILSKLSNYDEKGNTLITIDRNLKTVEIDNDAEEKEANYTLSLVNNYDENLTDVKILGKIGFSNNDTISTFDTNLVNPIEINVDNAKIYYSENKDASYEDDSWKEEFSSNAKLVKVVLDNNELAKKEVIEIKESINLPSKLGFNQESYLNWNVEYTHKEIIMQDESTIGIKTEENRLLGNTNNTIQNINTLEGETIPVSLSITPLLTNEYVHGGQMVNYKIQVTNNGDEDLTNLVLKDIIPDNAVYTYYEEKVGVMANYLELVKNDTIKEKNWEIELLAPGQTLEFDIILTMSQVTEEQEIFNKVEVSSNGQSISFESSLNLKPAVITTNLTTDSETRVNATYKEGSNIWYYVLVKNITDSKLENIKVEYSIPHEYEYVNGGLASYDEVNGYSVEKNGINNNGMFEYTIDKLDGNEEKVIAINVKVKPFVDKNEAQVYNSAKVIVNEDIYETNVKINLIEKEKKAAFEMNLKVNTNGKEILEKEDEVKYTITVKNIGENIGNVNIQDAIPEELNVSKLEYSINGEEKFSLETTKQVIGISTLLNKDDVLTIVITAKVKNIEVTEDTVLKAINQAILTSGELEIKSNQVEINIKPEIKIAEDDNENNDNKEDNNENNDSNNKEDDDLNKDENNNSNNDNNENENLDNNNGENGDTTNKEENSGNDNVDDGNNNDTEHVYSISGVAWLDENKDGKKDENEKLQNNITVSLLNSITGNYEKDANGNRIITTTDNEGKYVFNNIPKGNYIVLFEFDTNTYTVTTYQKSQVGKEVNSDAILKAVTIEGQTRTAGITDKFDLTSNKENIDIGLIENAVFDLSLNKQITKITVINSKGTEEYNYDEGDTAKVDLVAKYMNGADVIVTYVFTITNEGDVAGYVNRLVDDIPSGLEFSSELNKDWYKGNDGKLYITSLSGIAIKPGESIKVELVLTKNMTEDNTGVFPNNASLEKISNLENIQEKEELLDNNQSSAMLIISIKTGSVMLYIGITTICLAIIGIGVYLIKKKILNRVI